MERGPSAEETRLGKATWDTAPDAGGVLTRRAELRVTSTACDASARGMRHARPGRCRHRTGRAPGSNGPERDTLLSCTFPNDDRRLSPAGQEGQIYFYRSIDEERISFFDQQGRKEKRSLSQAACMPCKPVPLSRCPQPPVMTGRIAGQRPGPRPSQRTRCCPVEGATRPSWAREAASGHLGGTRSAACRTSPDRGDHGATVGVPVGWSACGTC